MRGMRLPRMRLLVDKEGLRMSCSVCAGYSDQNCPCCGEDVRMTDCPDCEGRGFVYLSFNIKTREFVKTTRTAYHILPENEDIALFKGENYCQGDIVNCKRCKSTGLVPED